MNLIGDGVHNLIDGMLIGASYTVSIPIGIATTLAVILHEIAIYLNNIWSWNYGFVGLVRIDIKYGECD
jgi:hypothetical protein